MSDDLQNFHFFDEGKQSYIGQADQLTLEQGSENANRVFDTYKYKSTFDSVEEFTM